MGPRLLVPSSLIMKSKQHSFIICSRVPSHLQRETDWSSKFRIFDCEAVHLSLQFTTSRFYYSPQPGVRVYYSPQSGFTIIHHKQVWIWWPCCTRPLSSWTSQGAAWEQGASSLGRSTCPNEAKTLLRYNVNKHSEKSDLIWRFSWDRIASFNWPLAGGRMLLASCSSKLALYSIMITRGE